MTTRQESKQCMNLAVKDFLAANAAIVTPLPNYAGFNTALLNGITLIQTYAEQQMFDKTGIATNKDQLRKTLVMLAADASRKIVAYAKYVNNQVLLSEIKFTESDLRNAADTVLRDNTQGIYDRAQTNLTALATYGITAATQTTLQSAINAFVAAIPKPRLGTTDKKQSTEQLANAFKATDAALANIDTLVEIIRLTQPNFYNGYKTARKIVETGTGSLTVKGLVVDANTRKPIKGVTISFSTDGSIMEMKSVSGTNKVSKVEPVLVKKTADKGGFNVKSLPAGMYTVTIKKNGYADQIETIAVSDGELTELKINLSKN